MKMKIIIGVIIAVISIIIIIIAISGHQGNGEEVCEGHGFSPAECVAISCCEWDDGDCWSGVGKDQCSGSNGRLKKTEFFNHHQKLSNCHQNFTNWSLGKKDQLMQRAFILLNLYQGRQ